MNIKEFKEGDIITRNEGMKYGHDGTLDGSYTGDRLILKGHDSTSKIIFFEQTDGVLKGDIYNLSYARDAWDEGWCYYPETLWQRIKKTISK